eukprot:s579_g17.t1
MSLAAFLSAAAWPAAAVSVCLLERLQHEPFWDDVPILASTVATPGTAAATCRPKSSTLLPATGALEHLIEAFHWPSLRQYLQPLAYISYADAVQKLDRISWQFPNWRAEGPLHETMTLSDGFNSYWQALQEALREGSPCRSASCFAAVLLGEIMQLAREALSRPHERPSLDDLLHSLRLRLPWKQWLDSSWSQALLESLLALLGALTAPVEGTAVEMEEVFKDLLAAADCKVVAANFLMSDFQSLWEDLETSLQARPLLRLVADCLATTAQSPPSFLASASERRLSHTLCDEQVQTLALGEDMLAHVHGASAFLQVDQMGQHWLRLEFLHFVSTSDGSVRLTVYGHLKRDRMYYAQALTLPLALVQKWRCSLPDLRLTEDARVASFFGYDAIAYCDLRLSSPEVPGELQPSLRMGDAGASLRLCPAPQRRTWRIAEDAANDFLHLSEATTEELSEELRASMASLAETIAQLQVSAKDSKSDTMEVEQEPRAGLGYTPATEMETEQRAGLGFSPAAQVPPALSVPVVSPAPAPPSFVTVTLSPVRFVLDPDNNAFSKLATFLDSFPSIPNYLIQLVQDTLEAQIVDLFSKFVHVPMTFQGLHPYEGPLPPVWAMKSQKQHQSAGLGSATLRPRPQAAYTHMCSACKSGWSRPPHA